jgi:hypothetical protein
MARRQPRAKAARETAAYVRTPRRVHRSDVKGTRHRASHLAAAIALAVVPAATDQAVALAAMAQAGTATAADDGSVATVHSVHRTVSGQAMAVHLSRRLLTQVIPRVFS